MTEEPLFFAGQAGPLFGVLHEPVSPLRGGMVFCHPFGEEKLWTHRSFVSAARVFAARGLACLRFDCRGNGDSHGTFSDSSIDSGLADLAAAIDLLRARAGLEHVGLLGLRLGASLAALAAERRSDIDRLVLWGPVLDGARYAQDLLRINITTQLAVYREVRQDRAALVAGMQAGRTANVDGYEMGLAMYETLSAMKLEATPPTFAGPVLIAQIDRAAQAPPAADLQRFAAAYPRATLIRVQEEPFWKEIERFYETAPNLMDATLSWLEER